MKNTSGLDRRRFLLAAGAFTAMATSSTTLASNSTHHHHGPNNEGLVKASAHCTSTGNACVAHCLILLGEGNKEMAECSPYAFHV